MPEPTPAVAAGIGRRRLVQGIGAVSLTSGVAMPAIAQNKPIRMGWIVAVTGMFATNAQAQDWGFHMAVQDLNEKGGLLGRKIEIVMRDSAADPSKAVSFAKELVYNENIDVLCGPTNSGEALPTLGIVSGAKKLNLIGGSVEELIDPVKYPLGFRNLNANGQWIKVAVKFMVEDLKTTKVAIINDNTGYGVLSRETVTKFLAEHNLKPVYTATVDPNKPDVTDELLKAQRGRRRCDHGMVERHRLRGPAGQRARRAELERAHRRPPHHPAGKGRQAADQARLLGQRLRHGLRATRSSMPRATCRPMSRPSWTSTRTRIGPYWPPVCRPSCRATRRCTIYAAGLNKAGDTDPFKVKAALESIPHIDAPYGPFFTRPRIITASTTTASVW